jgi:hypothetical protein
MHCGHPPCRSAPIHNPEIHTPLLGVYTGVAGIIFYDPTISWKKNYPADCEPMLLFKRERRTL